MDGAGQKASVAISNAHSHGFNCVASTHVFQSTPLTGRASLWIIPIDLNNAG